MEGVRGHPNPLMATKITADTMPPVKQLSKKLGPDALRQAALVLLESNPDLKMMIDTAVAEKDEALRERNAAFRMHEDISAKYKESMRTCENIRLALTRAADEAAREKKESGEQVAFLLDTVKQLTGSKELLVKEKAALETFFQEKLSAAESERAICLKTLETVRVESSSKIAEKMEETAQAKADLAAALQKVESTQQMYEKLYDTEVLYVRNVLIPETNRQKEAAEKSANQAIAAAAQSDAEMQSSKTRELSTQEAFQGLQKVLLTAQEHLEEQKIKASQARDKCAVEEQKARDALSQAIAAEESFQMASQLLQTKTDLEIDAMMKKCESSIEKVKNECEMMVSAAKERNESEMRLVRQLSDVEVAKYKALAENASRSSLDYATLHGYESWMQALESAQEDARQSRENEQEAMKQTGYVIEELKKMTIYKERAELETKQVMLKYGGLSIKQLMYPTEMNIDSAQYLLENSIKDIKPNNASTDSSSFFSSFRRKLKEKFSSFAGKEEDNAMNAEDISPKIPSPSIQRRAQVHVAISRNAQVATLKNEGSPLQPERKTHSPTNSPQKASPLHGNSLHDLPLSSRPSVSVANSSPSRTISHEDSKGRNSYSKQVSRPNEHDASEKMSPKSQVVQKSIAERNLKLSERYIKDDNSEHSSRTTNKSESHTSRPSSADSGSMQSERGINESRLPTQYQAFRARQSNTTAIPKLSFATPRNSDVSGPRYQMRRDISITDPIQCIWLQKASGPLIERIHVDFEVRVEMVKLTEHHKISGLQVALKGQAASVQSAAEFILSTIDNLRQVNVTLSQFDSTNPSITVSANEESILKDLKMQLKRLDQLPSFWPIDVDAKILELDMPNIPSPKSPKNAQFRSLQSPIIVTAIVSEMDRHFIDAISGNMQHIAELLGLRN